MKKPKSKKPIKKSVKKLTDAQVKELAGLLKGSSRNVYDVCLSRYGVKVDDKTFDRLESVGGVFRCAQCNMWLSATDDKSPHMKGFCIECQDEFDQEEAEENEEMDEDEIDDDIEGT